MANTETITLEIPNSPRYVAVARKALEAVAGSLPLTDQQVDDLKLALGEACTNAVKYGSPEQPTVRVKYKVSPQCLQIEVRNKGDEFDYGSGPHNRPDVAKLPVGGLGLYVIEQCVDELSIGTKGGETVLKMTKRL